MSQDDTLKGISVKLYVLLRVEKPEGAPFLEKIKELDFKLGQSVSVDDLKYYRILAVGILPSVLAHLKNLKSGRESVERGMIDLLSKMVCVLCSKETSFYPSLLLNLFASCLVYMDTASWNAQGAIISRLCEYIIPMTQMFSDSTQSLSFLPTTTLLHTVLDSTDEDTYHIKVLHTLMWLKRDVCSDVLAVVGIGTDKARVRAMRILVQCWLLPCKEYNVLQYPQCSEWSPPTCVSCHGDDKEAYSQASVVCLKPECVEKVLKTDSEGQRLYMYLCTACDLRIHGDECDHEALKFPPSLRETVGEITDSCDMKDLCVGLEGQKQAVVTCYNQSCMTVKGNRPVHLCKLCHQLQHGDECESRHVYQVGPPNPWHTGLRRMNLNEVYAAKSMLQAVCRLLDSMPEVSSYCPRATKASLNMMDREYSFTYGKEVLFLLKHFCTPEQPVTEGRKYWLTRCVAYCFEWLYTLHQMVQNQSMEDPTFPIQHLYKHSLWKDVMKWMVPWLQVVHQNSPQVFVGCLIPDLFVGAQIQEYPTEMEQYQHTLQVFDTLNWPKLRLFPDPLSYAELFSRVMTEWMEELSSSTNRGNISQLNAVFQNIFNSVQSTDELRTLMRFLEMKLNAEETLAHYKLLEWLQDLTSLGVMIPFLKEYFEEIISALRDSGEGGVRKKSGAGLVRGLSLPEEALAPNSPVSKCILILDIILAQLQVRPEKMVYGHSVLFTFSLEDVLSLMLDMLGLPEGAWSRGHRADHLDSSNPCSLCRSHELWFDLAAVLLLEYYQQTGQEGPTPHTDGKDQSPHPAGGSEVASRFKRLRVKLSAIAALKGTVSSAANTDTPAGQEMVVDGSGQIPYSSGLVPDDPPPPSAPAQPDRLRPINEEGRPLAVPEEPSGPETPGTPNILGFLGGSWGTPTAPEDGGTPTSRRRQLQRQHSIYDPSIMYKLFQKVVQKLQADSGPAHSESDHQNASRLHPQAIHSVVGFLEVFVLKVSIFEINVASKDDMLKDARKLFFVLWDQLQSENAFLAQKVTPLLLSIVEFIQPYVTQTVDGTREKPYLTFWKKIDERYFQNENWLAKFHAAEKVTLLAQFVKDFNELSFSQYAFFAHIFCCVVDLLSDPQPEVSARARYLLEVSTQSSLKGLVFCTTELFNFMPSQQSRVLKSLTTLYSALPSFGLVTYEHVIRKLFVYQRLWGEHKSANSSPHIPPRARGAKPSTEEHGGGLGNKQLREDVGVLSNSGTVLTEVFAFLFEILVDPASSGGEVAMPSEELVSKLELMLFYGRPFSMAVEDMRSSELLELFLSKVYKILDRNVTFCSDLKLIYFVLKLLVYVVQPSVGDFSSIMDQLDFGHQPEVVTGLDALDEQLSEDWLRVYFMICYKYGGQLQHLDLADSELLLSWATCCARIAIFSLLSTSHVCSLARDAPQQREIPTASSGGHTFKDGRSTSLFGDVLHGIPKPRPLFKQPSLAGSLSSSSDLGRSKRHRHSDVADRMSEDANIFRARAVTVIKRLHLSANKCSFCNVYKHAYSENIINLCVVAVGTFAHRFPKVVAPYLEDIVKGMARVIITGSYPWQDVKTAQTKPGSAIPVAKQFLNCILSQFGGRNLFLHLFKWNLKDCPLLSAILQSLTPVKIDQCDQAKGCPELMTQVVPVEIILKTTTNLHTLLRGERTLENLSVYLSLLKDTKGQQGTGVRKEVVALVPLLEQFLRKLLKPQNKEIVTSDNSWNDLVRIIILFIQFCKYVKEEEEEDTLSDPVPAPSSVGSLISLAPSIATLLEAGLVHSSRVSLYSLLTLCTSWYDAFSLEQKPKQEQERFLRLVGVHHLAQALQPECSYHRNSRIALIQFACLVQGGSHGYLVDFSGQKQNMREVMLDGVNRECSEAYSQLSVNLDCGIQLLCTPRFKEPLLQLVTAELLLKHLDSYSPHSPVQTLRAMFRPSDHRSTPDPFGARPSSVGGVARGVNSTPLLGLLTWLILASMRAQVVMDTVTMYDPMATSATVIHHTSTLVLRLLEHKNQDQFVRDVQKILMESFQCLPLTNTQTHVMFTFLQVWSVYLELVQDQLVMDVVAYLVDLWEEVAKRVQENSEYENLTFSFERCIVMLKKANITALPPLLCMLAEDRVPAVGVSADASSRQKSIGSLNSWLSELMQDMSKFNS